MVFNVPCPTNLCTWCPTKVYKKQGCVEDIVAMPHTVFRFVGLVVQTKGTTRQFDGLRLMDIIFCNRETHGITVFEDLVKFEIGVNKDDGLEIISELYQLS